MREVGFPFIVRRKNWLIAVAFIGIAGDGCLGTEETETDTARGALATFGYPQGLTCGIGYFSYNQSVYAGYCEGVDTVYGYVVTQPCCTTSISTGTDTNFNGTGKSMTNVSIGDRGGGLHSGEGYYAQELSGNTGVVSQPDWLELPQGAVCGLRETGNDTSNLIKCMGKVPSATNTSTTGCPTGWVYKLSDDQGASSGQGFGSCQYLDMHGVCPAGSPCANNQPSGLACGLTDTVTKTGTCLNLNVVTQGCPSGYTKSHTIDAGAGSGTGVLWCFK
jgi:hypothetical protein